MLGKLYRELDNADRVRRLGNMITNKADDIEMNACNEFNKVIQVEHIQRLCVEVDNKGSRNEKEEIHNILEKKNSSDLNAEDIKKYKVLDEKYGEGLEHNKTFLDRLLDNMGD